MKPIERSPLPWHTDGDGQIFGPNPDHDPTDPISNPQILIADTVAYGEVLTDVELANANFIVRACNAYISLMEALTEIADRGPLEGYDMISALRLRLVTTQSIAREALAKGNSDL